jgi:predicted alpha/beta superfamily hydrolase
MGTIMRITTFTLAGCLAFWALAVPAEGDKTDGYPRVSLTDTEVRTLTSALVDQEFKLHVYLPPGYRGSERRFPTVYLTDSDAYFGFFRSMIANLAFGNLVPPTVVVGIAYEEDTQSYLKKRERDLLPVAVANSPGSGQAETFVAFLREELFPFVESHYRVDPDDRTIAGMSAGATFAAYVLCTQPELFHRYVIVSPYLVFGQEVVLDLEAEYARDNDTLPVCVYTAMGELEPEFALKPWKALGENMRKRGYTDLEFERDLLPGLSHMDVVFTAYVNGIKKVFAERLKTLEAAPGNYDACAGTYEVAANGMRFMVRVDYERLFISRSGEYWDQLVPVSDSRYGVEQNPDVQFSFVADPEGGVARMIIHQGVIDLPAERIK